MTFRTPIMLETVRYSLQGIALAPVFLYVLQYPAKAQVRWLELSFLRLIGRLSYSMYLIHLSFLSTLFVKVKMPLLVYAPIAFAISLVYALGMRKFVELPLRGLRRRAASLPELAAAQAHDLCLR